MNKEDNEKPGTSKSKIPQPKPNLPPELDFRSELFDPLKALYSDEIPPLKNAPIYDNIAKFESEMKKNEKPSSTQKADEKAVVPKKNPFAEALSGVRRFLPHQEMIKGRGVKARHKRNIIQKMDQGFDGPMACLSKYITEKKRIKINTRQKDGILGYVTGYLKTFDKHWNVILTDVNEVWRRRKIHLCSTSDMGDASDCDKRLKELGVKIPQVKVKSLNRKYVECSRHIPQLMIRGEHIAIVTLDKNINNN